MSRLSIPIRHIARLDSRQPVSNDDHSHTKDTVYITSHASMTKTMSSLPRQSINYTQNVLPHILITFGI